MAEARRKLKTPPQSPTATHVSQSDKKNDKPLNAKQSPELKSAQSKTPVDLETFSIFFQKKININPYVFTILNNDPVYNNLLTLFTDNKFPKTIQDFWDILFKDWVNNNLPKADVENSHENIAILIYLAFHQPEKYLAKDSPYAELMQQNVIKEIWNSCVEEKKAGEKKDVAKIGKASGGLLNKAAELLLTLKYHGDNRYDTLIKNLLFFTAGSLDTAGAYRPYTYFLLGELALHDSERNPNNLRLAFEYFIFYLHLLPNKSKIIFRLDTIKTHTDLWTDRHPGQLHPFIEMMENFEKEFYQNHEAIRAFLETGKKTQAELYQKLFELMLASYFNNQTEAGKKNLDQKWLSDTVIFEAVPSINNPAVREQILSLPSKTEIGNPVTVYKKLKKESMLLVNQLRDCTVAEIQNAPLNKGAIKLTFEIGEKKKEWALNQEVVTPANCTANQILRFLENKIGFNVTIYAMNSLKGALNSIKGMISREVNTKDTLLQSARQLTVEKNIKDQYFQAATMYKTAAEQNLEDNKGQAETVRGLLNKADAIIENAQKTTNDPEPNELKLDIEKSTISEHGSDLNQYQKAIKRTDATDTDTIDDFMKEYDNDRTTWLAWLTSWFRSYNLRTPATPKPTEKEIITHAMENPYRFGGLLGNRTAKILYKKYGIDVSKAYDAKQPEQKPMGLGSTYYDEFKKICKEDKPALDAFYSAYEAKLPASKCTPYRATHEQAKQKTLIRIIEETKNKSIFSSVLPFFFPSYKRSSTVLEEQGADLKQKSSEIRSNLKGK